MNTQNQVKQKIMLVDDHAIVRQGLASLLDHSERYQVCCEAGTAKETLTKLKTEQPDIILLDFRLPDADGITLCHQIKNIFPYLKVVIFSAFAEIDMVREALLSGANGYLIKNADRNAILNALDRILSGETVIDSSLTESLFLQGRNPNKHSDLSEQETQILDLIGKGYSNKEIGMTLFLTEKTVRNYLTKIFEKIQVRNRTEAALFWRDHKKDICP